MESVATESNTFEEELEHRKKLLLRTGMAVMMKMAIIPETASMTRMVIM